MTVTAGFLSCVVSGGAFFLLGMLFVLAFGPAAAGLRSEIRDWLTLWRKGN
jgi:hypothetical protein